MAITINRAANSGGLFTDFFDIRCLSTDEKPTANIPNASTCVEIDTGRVFMYDIDGNVWHEISGE